MAPELLDLARERGVRATGYLVEPDGPALSTIAGLIDDGTVRTRIDEVLPLAQAAEAHHRGEQGQVHGKQVLRVES